MAIRPAGIGYGIYPWGQVVSSYRIGRDRLCPGLATGSAGIGLV